MNMHLHKPNWRTIGIRLEHLIHDPRFWAIIALGILFILMILTSIYSKGGQEMIIPIGPMNPYIP